MAMQTITGQETGSEFISKLNANFNGLGDGNVAVKVPTHGGELKASTGYVDGRWCAAGASNGVGTWTDDNYYKYLHTPLYLSLNGNEVKSVTVPSGSTLSIFCFDDAFTLISGGVVNDVDDIPDGTAYVKMQIYNSSGYTQVAALDMVLASSPEWVKNTGAAYSQQWFNYDCHPPKLWDDVNYTTPHQMPTDGTADVDNTRYHDNGVVILPPNYSPTGKPCKVVLWFNGDNCPWFIMHDAFYQAAHEQDYKYLAASGYAVAMCSGYTSMWRSEQGSTNASLWLSRITPAYIASVMAFYDWIMANYNFDPQVYVSSLSAGGGMLLYTAINRPFPVRAAAGLSSVVSTFDTMRHAYVGSQKTWQKRLGCVNWDDFVLSPSGSGNTATLVNNNSGASSSQIADADRLLANKDIIRKYDPFGMASDIDWDAFVTQCLLLANPYTNGEDYPTALTDIIYSSQKFISTPIKYWCATKDEATPYTWFKILVDWINRNGGIAELRSYTGSDGRHNTFDNWENVGKTASNQTQYGGQMTAGLGFVEAVEWFKRW